MKRLSFRFLKGGDKMSSWRKCEACGSDELERLESHDGKDIYVCLDCEHTQTEVKTTHE